MTILTLPTYLPIAEAAHKYGMSVSRLRALINDGTIKAAMVMNNLVVDEDEVAKTIQRKEDLPEYKKHAHLKGKEIWVSEAARKYNLLQATVSKWVKAGIIKQIGTKGNKILIDEADVAYCAEIYHSIQAGKQGRTLFDDKGLPYKPKTGPLSLEN
jgi:predicted site-specific integrase-resolvase